MSRGLIQNEAQRMINEKRQHSDSALRIASPIAKCSLSSLSLLIADINGDPHLWGWCKNKCQAQSSMNDGMELSLEAQFTQAIQQGDVILLSVAQIVSTVAPQEFMTTLTHLTLAEGEVAGYSCRVGEWNRR